MGAVRALGIAVLLVTVTLVALYITGTLLIERRETEPAPEPNQDVHTSLIQTRSGRVNVLDLGTGEVVVLVHGSGRSVADWEEGFASALAQNFRVVGFDNYGFGQSDRNHSGSYGLALWAREAIDVLDALRLGRVVILGHSSGAAVAAIVAADHPERIRGVVLVGNGMAIDPAQLLPALPGVGEIWASRIASNGEIFSERHRRKLEAAYRVRGTHAALLTFIRRQFTIDGLRLVRGTYEDIQVPVLQVHGMDDASIPIEAARALSQRIPDTRFVAVEGSGHNVHFDRPDRLASAVVEFVGGLGP
jgi:pimeloyl-ACP methyl ester carboxylesterase